MPLPTWPKDFHKLFRVSNYIITSRIINQTKTVKNTNRYLIIFGKNQVNIEIFGSK